MLTKWATAKNVGDWYQMVAENLVQLDLATWNAAYDVNAPLGSPSAELIIISKPDQVLSFDETRV